MRIFLGPTTSYQHIFCSAPLPDFSLVDYGEHDSSIE